MMSIAAQERPAMAPPLTLCEQEALAIEAPYYYCDCKERSGDFAFPMVIELKSRDTLWYQAEVKDLLQGLSAYWFSDCSVTLEAYTFCTGKVPTFTLTIGKNSMRDMDAQKINDKIQQASETMQQAITLVKPHVRVYLNSDNCTGTVYCYPYDQGPKSECDNPVPLYPGMTYVCDTTENVYRMESDQLPVSGKAFVHWYQKQNKPCEIWLTLDDCEGDTIGQAVLQDSLHVYQPNAEVLKQVREAGRSVWLHVRHEKGVTGRIYWRNNPKYAAEPLPAVDEHLCTRMNQYYSVDLRTYISDTAFTDTLWIKADSLTTRNVNIEFLPAPIDYDTVYMNEATIKIGYKEPKTGQVFRDFGNYTLTIESKEECTRILQLVIDREAMPTVCDNPVSLQPGIQGVCSNEEYAFRLDEASLPESGKAFVHWYQRQNKPCTVSLLLDSCTGELIGHTTLSDSLHVYLPSVDKIKKAKEEHHSVWLYLTQAAGNIGRIFWYNDPVFADQARPAVDKQVCTGIKINEEIDFRTYSADTAFTDTLWYKSNMLTTRDIKLQTVPQAMEYDTVQMNEITIMSGYYNVYTGETYTDFGDYTYTIEKANTCTRFIQLTIERVEIPSDPTSIERAEDSENRVRKILENGQLYILIDDRKYTLTGQQIQ